MMTKNNICNSNLENIEKLKESVVAIGYYIPKEAPEFHGTGFLVGEGDRAITCAHVVIPGDNIANKTFRSYPIKKVVGDKQAEFSCWSFRTKNNKRHIIRYPIRNIATYVNQKMEGLFFDEFIDVAYIELSIEKWRENFGDEKIPSIEVSKEIERNIGLDIVMIGFPSPSVLFIDKNRPEPKCWEPMSQFARLAGALPFRDAHKPEYLAIDTIFAKGSSGSPIINISNSKVIAMAAQLHPFRLPILIDDKMVAQTYVPSSLGFAVPSNFFYELSISRSGVGRFNF